MIGHTPWSVHTLDLDLVIVVYVCRALLNHNSANIITMKKISHVFNFLKFNLRSIYFGKNNFAGNVNVV